MQKAFTIISRGRKYFKVQVGTCTGELVINAASGDLQPGQEIVLDVQDVSERSRYGVTLRFLPITAADSARLAAEKARQAVEKWLDYAERDVAQGLSHTNAMAQILGHGYSKTYPELSNRIAALRAAVTANQRRDEEERAQREAGWAAERAAQAQRRQQRVLYPLSDLPDIGTPVHYGRGVIVYESTGRAFPIDENHPSVEGSHLLGHEGDLGCYCYYRPATEAEIASLAEQEQQAEAARVAAQARKAELAAIAEHIRTAGERPAGKNVVEGERVHDTFNAYGGGEAFVISEGHIWFLRNNGADGDNWAYNNVRTGGAGAIGWRIAYDAEIARRIRQA